VTWSLGQVLLVALGYALAVLVIAAVAAYRQSRVERGPGRSWEATFAFPTNWVRRLLLVVCVPPGLLLLAWIVVRIRAG
jgi:hypothetical protein